MKNLFLRLLLRFIDVLFSRWFNLVGTAIGEKTTDGQFTGRQSIVCFVENKLPLAELSRPVPRKLLGIVETDVIETGHIISQRVSIRLVSSTHDDDPRLRHRPLHPGVSIGRDNWSGTLGVFVFLSGVPYILTNWHVAVGSRGKISDRIYQPGAADAPLKAQNEIGRVYRYAVMRFWWFVKNSMDAALVTVNKTFASILLPIPFMGRVTEAIAPQVGMAVKKYGRTSRFTTGKILYLNATVRISYDNRTAIFKGQTVLTGMSQPGDSGSLIVSSDNKAVALLFAGSNTVTIATPIRDVLNRFGATLAS